MATGSSQGRVLIATICEIERGLFHVGYRGDAIGRELPIYQVGACAADARRLIEQQAKECGCDSVVWDHELVDPTLLLHPAAEMPGLTFSFNG